MDWFVPIDDNSLVPVLNWASSYSAFKAPMKHHLLREAFSAASFSEYKLLPSLSFQDALYTPQLHLALSVIYVPRLLQTGDLGVPC